MDVIDIFSIGDKTILTVLVAEPDCVVFNGLECSVLIENEASERVTLGGLVHVQDNGAKGSLDVWTTSALRLTRDIVASGSVRLVAEATP